MNVDSTEWLTQPFDPLSSSGKLGETAPLCKEGGGRCDGFTCLSCQSRPRSSAAGYPRLI
jgi:hypothetical protein